MLKRILSFYSKSLPSKTISSDRIDKCYKRLRTQTFIAATLGYSLYYVCRTSLNVMKQPIIDSGFLNATQLGLIAAGLMNIISGWLIDGQAVKDTITGEIIKYDFTYVFIFWVGAAVSFLLPILNWKMARMEL